MPARAVAVVRLAQWGGRLRPVRTQENVDRIFSTGKGRGWDRMDRSRRHTFHWVGQQAFVCVCVNLGEQTVAGSVGSMEWWGRVPLWFIRTDTLSVSGDNSIGIASMCGLCQYLTTITFIFICLSLSLFVPLSPNLFHVLCLWASPPRAHLICL